MKQKLYTVTMTALQYGLLWAGLRNQICWNIYTFLLVVSLLISVILFVASVMIKTNLPERGFPLWFYTASDFGLAIMLAAYGHFFWAGVTVIQLITEGAAFTHVPSREREAVATQQGWRF